MGDAIPLLICVTGHREIDASQQDRVRQAVQDVLRGLRRDYPHTPLAILSPLGSGADELVAASALELAGEIPVRLVAVLPWPKAVNDQIGLRERTRWGSALIENLPSERLVQIPLPRGVTIDGLRGNPEQRELCYDAVGRYIARHGQVLLAVWNGDESHVSHTAKVVGYHRRGVPAPLGPRLSELDQPELSAVYQIPVARPGVEAELTPSAPHWDWPDVAQAPRARKPTEGPLDALKAGLCRFFVGVHDALHSLGHWRHGPVSAGERWVRQRWQAIDRYNRDVGRLLANGRFAREFEQSRCSLVPVADAASLSPEIVRLREAYAAASVLASRWQSRHQWFLLALFAIALMAVACLEAYAHLFYERPSVLALYLVLLGCGLFVFFWTKTFSRHQTQWLDARALAEALRVQVYWRWAGKLNCVADHYLRHFRGELDWIRHALRAVYLTSGAHAEFPERTLGAERTALERVKERWISRQRDYFAGSAPRCAELEVTFETAARIAFVVAVGFAFLGYVAHLATHHISHPLVLMTFGGLVVAAILEEYGDLRAYALLARRYDWMASLFQFAEQRLDELISSSPFDKETVHAALELIFELGREALAENADWVVQHRQRPPVLPAG